MNRAVAAAALAALLGGCGPDRVETSVTNVLVPVERQREDLRRAHALGVIDDAELASALAEVRP